MLKRAYYKNSISGFIASGPEQILGELANSHHFPLDITQKNAWLEQIENLKKQLNEFQQEYIFFEFSIPRMGKRVDVLLFIDGVIFVLEYKTRAKKQERHAKDQALDYALDLKNFHEGSPYGQKTHPALRYLKNASFSMRTN